MEQLAVWQNFYILTGSACAELIALLFVVVALLGDLHVRITAQPIRAFGSPSVLHLTTSLIISAVLVVPWPSLVFITIVLGICGFGGIVYCPIVIHRARAQNFHKPVIADWLWYVVLPLILYSALFLAGLALSRYTQVALLVIGGVTLALMLIGLRNAWDSMTQVVADIAANDRSRE